MNRKDSKPKRLKKPWPTRDAMDQIYELNLWGGEEADFYSGTGSHHPSLTEPYIEKVSSFLGSFEEPLVVCDLGCGDFNVGKELVGYARKYVAVDIVESLIERNKRTYQADNLEFKCLDIAREEWPEGNCVILRQVLQHLSNTEIKSIIRKLDRYDYLILSEHLPAGEFSPNVDIISGQGTRQKKESGVDLLAPPFNLKVEGEERWLALPAVDAKGVVVTTLYQLRSSKSRRPQE